eukprot:545582-Rhodomonas_salina.4
MGEPPERPRRNQVHCTAVRVRIAPRVRFLPLISPCEAVCAVRCAMPGTDVVYGAMAVRYAATRALCGVRAVEGIRHPTRRHPPISLRARYAMSGTDIACRSSADVALGRVANVQTGVANVRCGPNRRMTLSSSNSASQTAPQPTRPWYGNRTAKSKALTARCVLTPPPSFPSLSFLPSPLFLLLLLLPPPPPPPPPPPSGAPQAVYLRALHLTCRITCRYHSPIVVLTAHARTAGRCTVLSTARRGWYSPVLGSASVSSYRILIPISCRISCRVTCWLTCSFSRSFDPPPEKGKKRRKKHPRFCSTQEWGLLLLCLTASGICLAALPKCFAMCYAICYAPRGTDMTYAPTLPPTTEGSSGSRDGSFLSYRSPGSFWYALDPRP